MRIVLPLLVALAVGLLAPVQVARAAMPTDDQGPAAIGLSCGDPARVRPIANVLDAKWSPDGHTLAVASFGRITSKRTISGYEEQEATDLFDLRTGTLRRLGLGDAPLWSGSGHYLSYWGYEAEQLHVTTDRGVLLASFTPTIPEIRWVGDTLLFVEKGEIREWKDGLVNTVARFGEDLTPKYPQDDLYWSADGERFSLTRYSQDGSIERFIGETRTGEMSPLYADASLIEWSPEGSLLLLRYADRLQLRDMAGRSPAVTIPLGTGAVHVWTPDARLLVGKISPTMPGGDHLDKFRVVRGAGRGTAADLPNVMGMRSFSLDGRYFGGVVRTGLRDTELRVYRCTDVGPSGPDVPLRAEVTARIEAIGSEQARFARPTAGEITQFLQGRHTGIDLSSPLGWPIFADDDGVVTSVEWVPVGGNAVCVDHSPGFESCYYHTSASLVTVGDRVVRGQPVALIGMTGQVTGPHTHWEVKLFGRVVDPLTR